MEDTSRRLKGVTLKLSLSAFAGHVSAVSSQGEYTPRNVQTRAQRAEEVL